ncbi:MAG: hypothetical protein WCP45_13660 [Verrucomicrobiota bacterium]
MDPEFYSPRALATVRRIKALGAWIRLGDAMQEGYRVVYHGIDDVKNLDKSETAAFLAPTDVDSIGGFRLSQSLRVPKSYFTDYPKGIAQAGELLIEVKGNVKKLALVPSRLEEPFLVSGSFFKALLLDRIDSGYVFAFLIGSFGKVLKERLCSNTIIDYIARADLESIPFPDLDSKAQMFLGDKVRQAERLRKRAGMLEADFVEIIRQQCPEVFGSQQEFGRSSRVAPASLRRNLNPGAFNPERLRIRAAIKNTGGKELTEVASIEATVTDSFGPGDDYIGLDSISSTTSQLAPVKIAHAEVEGSSRVLREGPVISKLRPYLNKVSYIPAELARAVGSTELLCVKPKPGVSGWFIYGVLKLQCTVGQFQPLANGSTLPRIDAADVLDVVVPWHDDADLLGRNLEQAQAMYFAAEKLTTAAALLVESLIEGKITETDLVSAQNALERGDPSFDRAMLSRVTRQGLDISDLPPLFPDVDALYALLAQTAPDTE